MGTKRKKQHFNNFQLSDSREYSLSFQEQNYLN